MESLRILFMSGREASYPRNASILNSLLRLGHEVRHSHHPPGARVVSAYNLARRCRDRVDLIVLGFFGQHLVEVAKRAAPGVPLILDAFISAFDTLVTDRGTLRPGSLSAELLRWYEARAIRIADHIVTDTAAHVQYFQQQFHIDSSRFSVLPVGTNDKLFVPTPYVPSRDRPMQAHFHGEAQRLHGLPTILEAARLLRDEPIKIRLVGKGNTFEHARRSTEGHLGVNVEFRPPVPYDQLPRLISEADVCLGIFGPTEKARRVVPNKVYEGFACGRPVLTMESDAMAEWFKPGADYIPCKPADAQSLATALRWAQENPRELSRVAQSGLTKYSLYASEVARDKILLSALRWALEKGTAS